jgi:hypothetical protein
MKKIKNNFQKLVFIKHHNRVFVITSSIMLDTVVVRFAKTLQHNN